jgi:hypothetical protein
MSSQDERNIEEMRQLVRSSSEAKGYGRKIDDFIINATMELVASAHRQEKLLGAIVDALAYLPDGLLTAYVHRNNQ